MPFRLSSSVAVLSCGTLMSLGLGCSHLSVKGQPPTAEDCAGARTQTTVGTVLALTGLASVVTGFVLIATTPEPRSRFIDGQVEGTAVGGFGALVGGALLGVVGSSLVGAAAAAKDQCRPAEACRGGAEPCKSPGVSATPVQPAQPFPPTSFAVKPVRE